MIIVQVWGLCCCLLSVIKAKKYLIRLELNFAVAKEKSRQTMQVKKSWRGCKPKLACQSILHINIGKICLAWDTKCPQDPLLPLSRIIFTFSLSHPLSVLIMLLLRYQCLISHPDSKDLIFYFSFLSFNC